MKVIIFKIQMTTIKKYLIKEQEIWEEEPEEVKELSINKNFGIEL